MIEFDVWIKLLLFVIGCGMAVGIVRVVGGIVLCDDLWGRDD
jgi:hypothetical protein